MAARPTAHRLGIRTSRKRTLTLIPCSPTPDLTPCMADSGMEAQPVSSATLKAKYPQDIATPTPTTLMPKMRQAATTTRAMWETSSGLTTKTRPTPRWLPHSPARYAKRWKHQWWRQWRTPRTASRRHAPKTAATSTRLHTRLTATRLLIHILKLSLLSDTTCQKLLHSTQKSKSMRRIVKDAVSFWNIVPQATEK